MATDETALLHWLKAAGYTPQGPFYARDDCILHSKHQLSPLLRGSLLRFWESLIRNVTLEDIQNDQQTRHSVLQALRSSAPDERIEEQCDHNTALIRALRNEEIELQRHRRRHAELEEYQRKLCERKELREKQIQHIDKCYEQLENYSIRPVELKPSHTEDVRMKEQIPEEIDLDKRLHAVRMEHVQQFVEIQKLMKESQIPTRSSELCKSQKEKVVEFYKELRDKIESLPKESVNVSELEKLTEHVNRMQDQCKDILEDLEILQRYICENHTQILEVFESSYEEAIARSTATQRNEPKRLHYDPGNLDTCPAELLLKIWNEIRELEAIAENYQDITSSFNGIDMSCFRSIQNIPSKRSCFGWLTQSDEFVHDGESEELLETCDKVSDNLQSLAERMTRLRALLDLWRTKPYESVLADRRVLGMTLDECRAKLGELLEERRAVHQ